MPKMLSSDKKPLKIKKFYKTWFEIGVERKDDKDVGNPMESYLIPPRVADYIELLEKKVLESGEKLPRISAEYPFTHDVDDDELIK